MGDVVHSRISVYIESFGRYQYNGSHSTFRLCFSSSSFFVSIFWQHIFLVARAVSKQWTTMWTALDRIKIDRDERKTLSHTSIVFVFAFILTQPDGVHVSKSVCECIRVHIRALGVLWIVCVLVKVRKNYTKRNNSWIVIKDVICPKQNI